MEEILKTIKTELKKRKITYEQFSLMCNIPTGTIRNLFSNRNITPKITTVNAMLDALEMQGYTKSPEGTVLTDLEMQIMEMVTNCSEREQKMVASYLAGMLDTRNLGNIKVEVPDRIDHYKKNPKY